MTETITQTQALTQALILGLTAKTEAKCDLACALAELISIGLTDEQVAACKAAALQIAEGQ